MTFEDFWEKIWPLCGFPGMAEEQIPRSLSDKTKRQLAKLETDDAVEIIKNAVNEIDHGSVKCLDDLVNAAIDR